MLDKLIKHVKMHMEDIPSVDGVIVPEFVSISRDVNGVYPYGGEEYLWCGKIDRRRLTEDAGSSLSARLLFDAEDIDEQISVWLLMINQELNINAYRMRDASWRMVYGMFNELWVEVKDRYGYGSWPYHHKSSAFPNHLDINRFAGPEGINHLANLITICATNITAFWCPVKIEYRKLTSAVEA